MIYARAHDQTVADDYFTAMQRVEQRMEIVPKENTDEVLKVQTNLFQVIEQLETPELCLEERQGIVKQTRNLLGIEQCSEPGEAQKHPPQSSLSTSVR
jgi:hypothetical protein